MREDTDSLEGVAGGFLRDQLDRATEQSSEAGLWAAELWQGAENQGLTLPAVAFEWNGSGGSLFDELAVIRAAAKSATPLPIGETALAGWMLARGEISVPSGPLTVGPANPNDRLLLKDGRVSGALHRTPWGRDAQHVVAVASGRLVILDRRSASLTEGANMAGEPRDRLSFQDVEPVILGREEDSDLLLCRGAAMRAAQIAAAASTAVEMAIEYAQTRKQFGQPIGSFQAVQQQIAVATSQVAAAHVAAEYAYRALEKNSAKTSFYCAIAKARASEAGGLVAGIAHQVHGAIGFTHDYSLHRLTRRIQSWRTEFGSEVYWARRVGEAVLQRGATAAWPYVTAPI